jgi:hypothetical protein
VSHVDPGKQNDVGRLHSSVADHLYYSRLLGLLASVTGGLSTYVQEALAIGSTCTQNPASFGLDWRTQMIL